MSNWPDALTPPDPEQVQAIVTNFWHQLAELTDLLAHSEYILAEMALDALRQILIEIMLSANGIAYPHGTRHLNGYLGESQRRALERSLTAEGAPQQSIVARAVALATIYQWYLPQMVDKYGVTNPVALASATWNAAAAALPAWPKTLQTT